MMACLTVGLALQGCGIKPIHNEEFKELVDNNVVRMTVAWPEKENKAYSPASYNVDAHYFKWSGEDIQYRWLLVKATMRRDKWGSVLRTTLIADSVPVLDTGDWVDVYLPPFDSMNYSEFKAPVILRLVCRDADSACKKKAEAELGGKNEVVSKGKPDMSNFGYTRKFDLQGNLLQH